MSDEPIDYATWGERFFATAVTAERVLAGVNVLSGRPIDVGPLGVGPGRIAKVTAQGRIGTATGQRAGADPVSFHVDLPVALRFTIDLGMDKQHFDAEITVPLVITAHARADLAIALEVTPPRTAQVVVRLKAQGLRASLTSRAANVEGEPASLRGQVRRQGASTSPTCARRRRSTWPPPSSAPPPGSARARRARWPPSSPTTCPPRWRPRSSTPRRLFLDPEAEK
ncbi:hypothetical protein G5V59_07635 [Nocardioides sp. W3-2-3]|nr:hypothetical protein [Nocardioides convexus]